MLPTFVLNPESKCSHTAVSLVKWTWDHPEQNSQKKIKNQNLKGTRFPLSSVSPPATSIRMRTLRTLTRSITKSVRIVGDTKNYRWRDGKRTAGGMGLGGEREGDKLDCFFINFVEPVFVFSINICCAWRYKDTRVIFL